MSTPQRTVWLNATVFLTGAGMMTVELVASRLIARYLGSSLYTWTGVLGVILAGMSLGNYIGGRMADSARNLTKRIAAMFFAGAAACLSILWLNAWAGSAVFLMGLSWPVRILLHMAWAFLLPATVLGTISPMVAKLAIERSAQTGRAIGTLYAWNAVGSIAGTFLTGFYLTAWMGSVRIVVSMALLLAALGVAYALAARRNGGAGRGLTGGAMAGFALFLMIFLLSIMPGKAIADMATDLKLRDGPNEPNAIFFAETQYQILTVTAEPGRPSHRNFFQDKLRHSEVDLAHPEELQYPYHRLYEGYIDNARGKNSAPIRLLCLGGGGYAYPQHLFVARPGSQIVAVEIDPVVTRAAQMAFGLSTDAPIEIHHMDARNYVADAVRLNRATPGSVPPFDFIICDSISDYTVPYHLTTLEFVEDVKALLKPNGMFIMNTVDIFDSGKFMNAVCQTLRKAFPNVSAISTSTAKDQRDTTVWAAGFSEIHEALVPASLRHPETFNGFVLTAKDFADLHNRNGECVLTDNWAPVENLLAPVVRMDHMGLLSAALQAGIQAADKQDYPRAVRQFRKALEIAPQNEDALSNLAHAQELAGYEADALDSYAALIQLYPEDVTARNRAALVLMKQGHMGPALEQWGESLKINPAQPDVLNNLGAAAMQEGQRDAAIRYWRQALEYAPGTPILLQNLAAAEAAQP
jgi:predicted membrane-bound spermidine synthase/Flp pilus assembly protein TadD